MMCEVGECNITVTCCCVVLRLILHTCDVP